MIQTAEFMLSEKQAISEKIKSMPKIKRYPIRITDKIIIFTKHPDGAKERWLSNYQKSDNDRIKRGRQHK